MGNYIPIRICIDLSPKRSSNKLDTDFPVVTWTQRALEQKAEKVRGRAGAKSND